MTRSFRTVESPVACELVVAAVWGGAILCISACGICYTGGCESCI